MAEVLNSSIPQAIVPFSSDGGSTLTLPWRRFFQSLSSLSNNSLTPADVAALEALANEALADAQAAQAAAAEALAAAALFEVLPYIALASSASPEAGLDAIGLLGIAALDGGDCKPPSGFRRTS
jgi:hypothetical protein